MKLMSLNVECFKANNLKLARFLNEQQLDIICFQEVTRALDNKVNKKYITKDPIDEATKLLKYGFFGHTDVFNKIKLDRPHEGEKIHFDPQGLLEMGNYIKSNLKIKKSRNVFLEGRFPTISDHSDWPDKQRRAAQVVDLDCNGKNLRVINYHGIWTKDKMGNSKTYNACNKILDLASNSNGEVVICGDFNLFPNSSSMRIFDNKFVSLVDIFGVKTTRSGLYKTTRTVKNIVDYVFVSKEIKIKNFRVIDTDVSDHLPLELGFDL